MLIQCKINRDGVTTVMYAGVRYDFEPNEHGDYVCPVAAPGAVNHFLKTIAGKSYCEYVPPVVEEPAESAEGEPVKPAKAKRVKSQAPAEESAQSESEKTEE